MELEHHFEVPVGIDDAWAHLLDMGQIAACFPGATLTSGDGHEYTGSVKVKLGPIQLVYEGSARIIEADETIHQATIEASGSAARSGSTAVMTVIATAESVSASSTAVTMKTNLTITGRPAQFGRGVMSEVGDKILGRFADCLSETLTKSDNGGVREQDADTTASVGSPSSAPAAASGRSAESDSFTHVPITAASHEPIDLLESARGSIIKRLAPVVGGLILLWLMRALFRRRETRLASS